jgi:hypothetical protein
LVVDDDVVVVAIVRTMGLASSFDVAISGDFDASYLPLIPKFSRSSFIDCPLPLYLGVKVGSSRTIQKWKAENFLLRHLRFPGGDMPPLDAPETHRYTCR